MRERVLPLAGLPVGQREPRRLVHRHGVQGLLWVLVAVAPLMPALDAQGEVHDVRADPSDSVAHALPLVLPWGAVDSMNDSS